MCFVRFSSSECGICVSILFVISVVILLQYFATREFGFVRQPAISVPALLCVTKCLFAISGVSPRGRGDVSLSAFPAIVPVEGRKIAEAEQVGDKRISRTSKCHPLVSKCDLVWALLGHRERHLC